MISAIVLAAGKSARMGAINKMLLPFRNSTVIGTVINELKQSLIDEIIIVENQSSTISGHLDDDPRVKFITNLSLDAGLASSIQCGVREASKKASGFLICLGDMPLLNNKDYKIDFAKLLLIISKPKLKTII